LKRGTAGSSDEDDSLDSTHTAFTNRSALSNRSVTFNVPEKDGESLEQALEKKGVHLDKFNAWRDDNRKEYDMILKLHATTKNRVIGIRKLLRTWSGAAAAGDPSKDP